MSSEGALNMEGQDLLNPAFLKADNPVTLIVIGSTGSTKSALGNFLLDPSDEHIFDQPTFKVGHTGASETKGVTVGDRRSGVRVVDTAGLNESHDKDWKNMINCVRDLREIGRFNSVLLVMKFENRMDQPWRDTVTYYKKLMGEAFTGNLIVVLNGYKPGSRQYKASGDPLHENLGMAADQVKSLLQLSSSPLVFATDSYLSEPAHSNYHLTTRHEILRCAASQHTFSLAGLLVPKTPWIQSEDMKEAERLEGQLIELQGELKRTEAIPAEAKEQIATFVVQRAKLKEDIKNQEVDVEKFDTHELVELSGQRWSTRVYDKAFGELHVPFDIHTPATIRSHRISKSSWVISHVFPSTSSWVIYQLFAEPRRFHGLFETERRDLFWRRGFHAEIKLFSWSKEVYADQIATSRKELDRMRTELRMVGSQILELQSKIPALEAPVAELKSKISAIVARINVLKETHLTVEQAEDRHVSSVPSSKM